jgi:hypothetical protein
MTLYILSVYPTDSEINIILFSSREQAGITFTPIVFKQSYEIFGLNVVLESIGTDAVRSCRILFIGNDNEIVAITGAVRSAIIMITINEAGC